MTLWVSETFTNETEGYRLSDDVEFESRFDTAGEVFRSGREEHGRCVGRVYVDDGVPVGWVFSKRVRYEDCDETYLQTVWLTLMSNFLSQPGLTLLPSFAKIPCVGGSTTREGVENGSNTGYSAKRRVAFCVGRARVEGRP